MMPSFPSSDLNLPSSGDDVPSTHCVDNPPPTEVACEVACPADCVISPWSSWSPCSHSCATKTAEGRQSRTRTVLAIPGKGNTTSPLTPWSLFPLGVYKSLLLGCFCAELWLAVQISVLSQTKCNNWGVLFFTGDEVWLFVGSSIGNTLDNSCH